MTAINTPTAGQGNLPTLQNTAAALTREIETFQKTKADCKDDASRTGIQLEIEKVQVRLDAVNEQITTAAQE